jgi:hypothetical protein
VFTGRRDQQVQEAQNIKELIGLLPVTLRSDPASSATPPLDALQDMKHILRRQIHIDGLRPGEYCVYRVTQLKEDTVLGGYTIIAHRSQVISD